MKEIERKRVYVCERERNVSRVDVSMGFYNSLPQ